MQTQLITEPRVGVPWLERFSEQGGAPERIRLESYPFTIGRIETCDLPIDSAKVSREHAVIRAEGGRYRIEDLGSTNGTMLNGQRIEQAVLGDGDILLIANVEFSFYLPGSTVSRTQATQVLDLQRPDVTTVRTAAEVISGVRRLGEVLHHRAIMTALQSIVDLGRGRVLGYTATGSWHTGPGEKSGEGDSLMAIECRLTGQIRRLERMMAVEAALGWPGEEVLFVQVHGSEVGDPALKASLVRLREVLPAAHGLVAELPESAAGETPFARELRTTLRESGIGAALPASAGGAWIGPENRPEFLVLNKSTLHEAQRNAQRRHQLESTLRAGREAGCETVASGVTTEEEAQWCRGLGIRFGRGDYFGLPRPVEETLGGTN